MTAAVRELPHDVAVLTDEADATPLLGGFLAVVHAGPRPAATAASACAALDNGQRLPDTAALATGPLA